MPDPKAALESLLAKLEASRASRLRAWQVLQEIRAILTDLGNVAIPTPKRRTFELEGQILEPMLTKSLRDRNDAIKAICAKARRFRDATLKDECKSDYPHALQAMLKALDRAEDLIQP